MLALLNFANILLATLFVSALSGCNPAGPVVEVNSPMETNTLENRAIGSQDDVTVESSDDIDRYIDILENSRDKYARADAAAKLADFEDQYERFAQPLAKLLVERDEVLSGTAARIFDHLGPKGVEALNPDFDGDLNHLRLVCSAINAVGDGCEQYIPDLLAILTNDDDIFRRTAATFALTGFSNGNADSIDLILRDLEHQDMNVSLFAMRLIIKTGKDAKQAATKLMELYENGVPSQRGYAVWSLAAIGPTDDFDSVEAVGTMLNRFTVSERERGLIAAGLLGQAAQPHTAQVKKMMEAELTNIEGQAAVTYWQITGDADSAIQRLIELSRNSVDYELNGLKLIAKMGPAAAPAMDLLTERLGSADPSIQVAALDALRSIGPAANVHQKKFNRLVETAEDPFVKLAARQLLESLEE